YCGANGLSCCGGYCGELFCGSIQDTPDCRSAPTQNPACTSSFLGSYQACCTAGGAIVVPAGVMTGPTEWTGSLGDTVARPSDGGPPRTAWGLGAPANLPPPHPQGAVGAVGAPAAHDAGIGLGVALVGFVLLRRHARRAAR